MANATFDLDFTLTELDKPKLIRFSDGKEAKVYKPSMQQLIKLSLFVKKYEDIKDKSEEDIAADLELTAGLVNGLIEALEELIPEMKGQNLSVDQLFKLLNLIMADAIPEKPPTASLDTGESGDDVSTEKKI